MVEVAVADRLIVMQGGMAWAVGGRGGRTGGLFQEMTGRWVQEQQLANENTKLLEKIQKEVRVTSRSRPGPVLETLVDMLVSLQMPKAEPEPTPFAPPDL